MPGACRIVFSVHYERSAKNSQYSFRFHFGRNFLDNLWRETNRRVFHKIVIFFLEKNAMNAEMF